MFIRKRITRLKSGELVEKYQIVFRVKQGDKKVRKSISLGEYADPIEALEWERIFMERAKKCVEYPLDRYKEIRHSVRYNRPVLVSLPIATAKKRRMIWVKIHKKHKEKAEVLEKLASELYRKQIQKRRLS